ncbi:MAG TPA: class I SAM-dependent methyltransferase [Mycobacteriales bacterium]|nr:class I SAM-dependent methyltransferase [Mycobacteriales bacterium]
MTDTQPYFRRDLAQVHAWGFGALADQCAAGILELLGPVRGGLVLELGCGAGRLTAHLVAAGHRVLATDASPPMVELAARAVPAAEVRRLALPDDPVPAAAAVVSVGHMLNYLADAAAVERALVAMAAALRPGGVLAIDLCDLSLADRRRDAPPSARVNADWAIISRTLVPAPDQLVRQVTTFLRDPDGRWRRADERHDNVLLDPAPLVDVLTRQGLTVEVRPSFGADDLPAGMVALIGRRPG